MTAHIFNCAYVFIGIYQVLTKTEMTVIKCLFICKWSYMAMLDDYFVGETFLIIIQKTKISTDSKSQSRCRTYLTKGTPKYTSCGIL